ncbi:MAG: LacI family DNA-binding transcriptional regulator [Clostridiales bacterium]|nr:LacI family DNA-binding transcriptional regulator [Clostridiales bacterium]
MPSGRVKSGKVTMQDIASKLNITKVSVSKALNNQKGVSKELRRKVFALAQEMGYERVIAENTCKFAFIVSKHFFLETDAFYSEIYYYFNKFCIQDGHHATLMIVNNSDEQKGSLPPQLQTELFQGIAIAGEMSERYLRLLAGLHMPTVLMDFESEIPGQYAILTDNYYWGYRVTEYLIRRGHRHIGFVGPIGSTESITDRFYGYRRALLMNGLPYEEAWTLVNNDTQSGMYKPMIDLPAQMPTAFVCHCDMAAHYLIGTMTAKGIRCPEDVSVISFDDTTLAQTNQPKLTSVSIDVRAFARRGIETLCDIREGCNDILTRIYLPAELNERDSVGDGPAKEPEASQ